MLYPPLFIPFDEPDIGKGKEDDAVESNAPPPKGPPWFD